MVPPLNFAWGGTGWRRLVRDRARYGFGPVNDTCSDQIEGVEAAQPRRQHLQRQPVGNFPTRRSSLDGRGRFMAGRTAYICDVRVLRGNRRGTRPSYRIGPTGLQRSASRSTPFALARTLSDSIRTDLPVPEVVTQLIVPADEDASHGAMSMAVWGVPRIDPWLDLLTASLSVDRTLLPALSTVVGAGWWRMPPWLTLSEAPELTDPQEALWLAAIRVFRDRLPGVSVAPNHLAERIAAEARRFGAEATGVASRWLGAVREILSAESTIQLSEWRSCPVGIAIQLVLARPEPRRFRTWFKDLPGLPPAVAWSGTALCGLLHGYRRLDIQFRGTALEREFVSIHALRTCNPEASALNWPSVHADRLKWRRQKGEFVLSCGNRDFATRPEKARGRWFASNLDDAAIAQEAMLMAQKLNWECTHREIDLTDSEIPLMGSGGVYASGGPVRRLEVRGQLKMRLPRGLLSWNHSTASCLDGW